MTTAAHRRNLTFAYSDLAHAPHPDSDRRRPDPWCGCTSRWRPVPTDKRVSCTKCLRRMALDEATRGVLTGPRAQCPQCGDLVTTTADGIIGGHRQHTRTQPWCRGAGATPLSYAAGTTTWRCTIDTGFPDQAPTGSDHITLDLARRHLTATLLHRANTGPQPGLRGTVLRGTWTAEPGHRVAWTPDTDTADGLRATVTHGDEPERPPAVTINRLPVATPKGTFAGHLTVTYPAHDRARAGTGDTDAMTYQPSDSESCPVTIRPLDFHRGPDGTWTPSGPLVGVSYVRDGQTRQFPEPVQRLLTDAVGAALAHQWTPQPDAD